MVHLLGGADRTSRVRRALALVLIAIVVAVVWALRSPAPPEATPSPGAPSGTAAPGGELAKGASWAHVQGERESVSFEAPSWITDTDGTQRLAGDEQTPVRVKIAYQARGEPDSMTIEAQRCVYRPEKQHARFEGNVHIVSGLGLDARTSAAEYRGDVGLAQTPEVVEFSRKQISGRGRGLQFDVREGRLALQAEVQLRIANETRGVTEITGDRATFEKESGELEISGHVQAHQGNTSLSSDRLKGTVRLPDYALNLMIAVGHVRIVSEGADLTRQAGLQAAPGRYVLSSERVELPLRENGSPEAMQAGPGGVRFDWQPRAAGGRELRRLDANAAKFVFDEEGRLSKVHALKEVVVRRLLGSRAGAPGEQDELRCGYLFAVLEPETGEVQRGEFSKGVVLTRGRQRAVADRAYYSNSQLELLGDPQVDDPEAGVKTVARQIGIGVGPKQGLLTAEGGVRQTLSRQGPPSAARGGFLQAPELLVQCETLSYDAKTKSGLYAGDALLRAGRDEVRARRIQVRENEGRRTLLAQWRVHSVWNVSEGEGQPPSVVYAKALSMQYSEAQGRVLYSRQVEFRHKDLVIRTPESVQIDVAEDNSIRGLVAGETSVSIEMGGRKANGAQARYAPREGQLVLSGRSVSYTDAQGTLGGRSLTLQRGEDRILMDGRHVQRTTMTIRRGSRQP